MRPFLVFPIIACLLLCPIRCADGSCCVPEVAISEASEQHCCSHERGRGDADERKDAEATGVSAKCSTLPTTGTNSSQPCDDCSCATCICNGAILGSQADSEHSVTPNSQMVAVIDSSIPFGPAIASAPRVEDKPPVQRFSSGRQCRIELQSFLI